MDKINKYFYNKIFTKSCLVGDAMQVLAFLDGYMNIYFEDLDIEIGLNNAISNNQIRIIRMLLEYKVQVSDESIKKAMNINKNDINYDLITALIKGIEQFYFVDKQWFIELSVEKNYIYGLELLINLKQKDILNEMLLLSSKFNNIENIELSLFLIENGADIDILPEYRKFYKRFLLRFIK